MAGRGLDAAAELSERLERARGAQTRDLRVGGPALGAAASLPISPVRAVWPLRDVRAFHCPPPNRSSWRPAPPASSASRSATAKIAACAASKYSLVILPVLSWPGWYPYLNPKRLNTGTKELVR